MFYMCATISRINYFDSLPVQKFCILQYVLKEYSQVSRILIRCELSFQGWTLPDPKKLKKLAVAMLNPAVIKNTVLH